MIIFSLLEKLGIPYLVVKYRVSSPLIDDVTAFRYQIIVDYDHRLRRMGFRAEREIERYQGWYMYRELSPREIAVFRNYGYEPDYRDVNGTAWEFGGKIKRYRHGNASNG